MKRFSIIIPAYNVADYIERSIKSVINQSFKNYELIIVNDCSTDEGKTENVINKFKDYATIINHEQNMGPGNARNTGIMASQGEYIVFLDSDDVLYDSSVLENLDNNIGNQKPDIIQLGFKAEGTKNFEFIPNEEFCSREFQVAENKYINIWSKCWNREFLLKNDIKFPENVLYEDVSFVVFGTLKAKDIIIYPHITHIYTAGRAGSNATKNQFKQGRDTVTCMETLTNLKDKIDTDDLPLLLRRIKQQETRLIARLDRVLKDNFPDLIE